MTIQQRGAEQMSDANLIAEAINALRETMRDCTIVLFVGIMVRSLMGLWK